MLFKRLCRFYLINNSLFFLSDSEQAIYSQLAEQKNYIRSICKICICKTNIQLVNSLLHKYTISSRSWVYRCL